MSFAIDVQEMVDFLVGLLNTPSPTGDTDGAMAYVQAAWSGLPFTLQLSPKGYLAGTWLSTFAGFAPADDPAVTVVVVVDDPRGVYYGGLVAAPVFQEITEHAMRMLRVAPDAPLLDDEGDGADR